MSSGPKVCAGCGRRNFRKGARRPVAFDSGEVKIRKVCGDCCRRGIVVSTRTRLCILCPSDDHREGEICKRCANAMAYTVVREALAPFVERIRGLLKLQAKHPDANGPGLELALDILVTGGRE